MGEKVAWFERFKEFYIYEGWTKSVKACVNMKIGRGKYEDDEHRVPTHEDGIEYICPDNATFPDLAIVCVAVEEEEMPFWHIGKVNGGFESLEVFVIHTVREMMSIKVADDKISRASAEFDTPKKRAAREKAAKNREALKRNTARFLEEKRLREQEGEA